MNALDIFYNEVVEEAKNGVVKSFFSYNVLFETIIEEENKYLKCDEIYDGVIVPVLRIKHKDMFDTLLIEYVNKAKEFYQESNYLNDILVTAKLYQEKVNIEKILMTLLWSNATYDDFENPLDFLKRRIAFLDSHLTDTEEKFSYIPMLNGKLKIEIKKDEIYNETPYKMIISLINDDNEKFYFPEIKFGIAYDTVYFYAIQNKQNKKNAYSKKVNRILYKIGENFNEEENEIIYGIGNLKDISASFLVAINIAINYFKNLGIKNIVASSILLTRWNAKRISYEKRKISNRIDAEKYEELIQNQSILQSNLTEKFIRTFLRLVYHCKGLNVTSYPFDIDSNLHLDISDNLECNNELLEVTRNALDKEIKNKIF